MFIKESDISNENIDDLLKNIFLSIKSNEYEIGDIYNNEININFIKINENIHYSFNIKKENKYFWNKYLFTINIKFLKSFIHNNIVITKNQTLIKEIYYYLIKQEENKNKLKTNIQIESIINDISSSIGTKYKRDDKINKITNKNK